LANTLGLAILLGAAYEIGQAAVLFSILMSQNRNRMLAWGMMFLLTALQITANVYASFKFMDASGSNDWTYWQRAILFGVQAENNEMYKVIISWISGALLPVVALGMTALVADNIRMANGEKFDDEDDEAEDNFEEIVEHEVRRRLKDQEEEISETPPVSDTRKMETPVWTPEMIETVKEMKPMDYSEPKEAFELIDDKEELVEEIPEEEYPEGKGIIPDVEEKPEEIKPVNKVRGWHFMDEFVDDEYNVFKKGKFILNNPEKIPTSALKKA